MFWNSDNQLSFIPKELLEKSDKILIICYLAIGDFTYLQTCFKKLHEQYPNLKIDLWADEYRGRSRLLRWKNKKNDILYEWVKSTPYFHKFYSNIGAWWNFNKFVKALKQENYPVVVSLFCSNRQGNIAKYARMISPNAYFVGMSDAISEKLVLPNFGKHYLNNFDRFFLSTKQYSPTLPIMDYCANSFEYLFGFKIKKEERKTFIEIPEAWQTWARDQIKSYKAQPESKVVLINIFAKMAKRCWTPQKAIDLIKQLSIEPGFENCVYLINSMPQNYQKLEALFKKHFNSNVF
jgi:heptosyltransferase III